MMKSILPALFCVYIIVIAHPAAGKKMKPAAAEAHDEKARQIVKQKVTSDDLAAVRMMEMLNMMKMLQQLDLMEDYEIVVERKNEKDD